MTEIEKIRASAAVFGITRLCHFTPLRNLVHIATGAGLQSTLRLTTTERAEFNQQDTERFDGYPEYISCSIEYPNAYYVRNKRQHATAENRLFPDWVCLYIHPKHLWREDTLLCPHNAAAHSGANVGWGSDVFSGMFAQQVQGSQRLWTRRQHPTCCPTDAQAEVLVKDFIPLSDIIGLAVGTEAEAKDTYTILAQLAAPVDRLPLVIVPDYWDATRLAVNLSQGRRPVEQTWHPAQHEPHDRVLG